MELLHKGIGSRMRRSGLAAVQLAAPSQGARRACQLLDGKPVLGRRMIVRPDRFVEDQAAAQAQAAGAVGALEALEL